MVLESKIVHRVPVQYHRLPVTLNAVANTRDTRAPRRLYSHPRMREPKKRPTENIATTPPRKVRSAPFCRINDVSSQIVIPHHTHTHTHTHTHATRTHDTHTQYTQHTIHTHESAKAQ